MEKGRFDDLSQEEFEKLLNSPSFKAHLDRAQQKMAAAYKSKLTLLREDCPDADVRTAVEWVTETFAPMIGSDGHNVVFAQICWTERVAHIYRRWGKLPKNAIRRVGMHTELMALVNMETILDESLSIEEKIRAMIAKAKELDSQDGHYDQAWAFIDTDELILKTRLVDMPRDHPIVRGKEAQFVRVKL